MGQLGFAQTVVGNAAVLALVLTADLMAIPAGLPRGRKGAKFADVFSKDKRINQLSLLRMFLLRAGRLVRGGYSDLLHSSASRRHRGRTAVKLT